MTNLTRSQRQNIIADINYEDLFEDDNLSIKLERQVSDMVNRERAQAGISPLQLRADISAVARAKSRDMKGNRYFSHQSPNYGSPFEMLMEFGITYRYAGENIARGQQTPGEVMRAWMNSEDHKRNILNRDYNEIGVGYVNDSGRGPYWTQMFLNRN